MFGQEVYGPGTQGDDDRLEQEEKARIAPQEVEQGDGQQDRFDVGAQAVGEPLDIGHGKGAAVPGVPHRLIHVAQVKGGGLEGVVLKHCQGGKEGDVGQYQRPDGNAPENLGFLAG